MREPGPTTLARDAERLLAAGDHRGALGPLRAWSRLAPRDARMHLLMGTCLAQTGQPKEAMRALRKALQLDPGCRPARLKLADLLADAGQGDQALACCTYCLAEDPRNPQALTRAIALLEQLDRLAEALPLLERARRLPPQDANLEAFCAEVQIKAGDIPGAVQTYQRLLPHAPPPRLLNNLGALLLQLDRVQEAIQVLTQAVSAGAAGLSLYGNLVKALLKGGDARSALDWAGQFAQAYPAEPEAHLALAVCQAALGRLGAAREAQETAQDLSHRAALPATLDGAPVALPQDSRRDLWDPQVEYFSQWFNRLGLCDWSDYGTRQAELLAACGGDAARGPIPLVPVFKAPLPAELKLRIDRGRSRRIEAHVAGLGWRGGHRRDSWRGQRIRVGYISADFREHAVGLLIKDLFSRHDRRGFEIYAYDLWSGRKDKISAEIARGVDRYRELQGQTNVAGARRIEADKIQILVDLMGYTAHGRPEILALRPAPVQINYLGYPGSLGAEYMDYIVGTELLIPREHQALYDEQIIRLPHSHNIVGRWPEPGRRPDRDELGLPAGVPVVAAFGGADKLDPGVFDVWMRILGRVADSRLWLYAKSPDIERNLSQAAGSRGIDPRRLIFAPRVDPDAHLARLGAADLYLDTRIYSGFTTIAMALWAGLPVLSCLGDGYGTRMGAVAVQAAGLGELVVDDWQAYEDLAVALLEDPDRLAGLRRRLETDGRRSPLFDQAGYTRHLEQAYAQAWALYAAGDAPRPIWIPA